MEPKALEAKREAMVLIFDDFEREVHKHAGAMSRGFGRGAMVLAIGALVLPLLVVASIKGLEHHAQTREPRYVIVDRDGARCVARIHHSLLGLRRAHDHSDTSRAYTVWGSLSAGTHWLDDESIDDLSADKAVAGKTVLTREGLSGKVTAISEDDQYDNALNAEIDVPGVGIIKRPVCELCFTKPKPKLLADLGRAKGWPQLALAGRHVVVAIAERLVIAPIKGGKAIDFNVHLPVRTVVARGGVVIVHAASALYRVQSPTTKPALELFAAGVGEHNTSGATIAGEHVYWKARGSLRRAPIAGGTAETLIDEHVSGFGLKDNIIYFVAKKNVYRQPIGGKAKRISSSTIEGYGRVVFHDGDLYVGHSVYGTEALPLAGGEESYQPRLYDVWSSKAGLFASRHVDKPGSRRDMPFSSFVDGIVRIDGDKQVLVVPSIRPAQFAVSGKTVVWLGRRRKPDHYQLYKKRWR